jgi:hypothetical protein
MMTIRLNAIKWRNGRGNLLFATVGHGLGTLIDLLVKRRDGRASIPGRGKRIFSSPKSPDRL